MPHLSERCLNCGEPVPQNYCAACGQKSGDYRESLRELLADAVDELLQLDSRLVRTIRPFLFRPGLLTREFNAGRRVRYSSPLRLFLVTSFAYFFAVSFMNLDAKVHVDIGEGGLSISPSGSGSTPPSGSGSTPPSRTAPAAQTRIDRWLSKKTAAIRRTDDAVVTQRLLDGLANHSPKAFLILLPLFALLLKLLYLRRRRFYVEHLVFALHIHSFVFVALLATSLVGVVVRGGAMAGVSGASALVVLTYLLVAMRLVYEQSWLRTTLKFVVLLMAYALLVAPVVAALVAFVLLSSA